MVNLNAHERPPALLRQIYKKYSKRDVDAFASDNGVIDLAKGLRAEQHENFAQCNYDVGQRGVAQVFETFLGHESTSNKCGSFKTEAYKSTIIDGLVVIPSLLPIHVQRALLSRMLHRDLSQSQHKTNLDLHYALDRPEPGQSFFECDPDSAEHAIPRDSDVHKSLTVRQILNKKLRWMTLGGQYDWTQKIYAAEEPPAFPEDIKALLAGLFPQTTAEAAIVNLYSPGDTLSLHRDVSEECDRGLISISIGCDCLFILGLASRQADQIAINSSDNHTEGEQDVRSLVLRLHSGDAVFMSGESRFAWHGVPLIIPDTCPGELRSWPADDEHRDYDAYTGWMASKRINLNVRQMKE